MADPYVPFHAAWKNYPDTTTPVTSAFLEYLEAGLVEAISRKIVDAKGDLIIASAADAVIRKAVGADNTVLAASAADTGGVTWKLITNAMIDTAAAIARSKLAVQTRRYPINLHTARTSTLAGNAVWTVAALTDYDAGHWEYVKDVDGKVYGHVMVPSELAATPNAKIILSVAANATTGVTRLQVATKDPADAESLNPAALVDETAQDITVPGTAYLRKDVTFTLTNVPAAGDYLIVEVHHNGAHVNDTLAVNTLLFGAWLEVDTA